MYNYYFGGVTRTEGPPPGNNPNGAINTTTYDGIGRVDRVTTTNTGAYTRFYYGPDYTQSWTTINSLTEEAFSVQISDGLGQVMTAASQHPGSAGGYKAIRTEYDNMGRPVKVSNPAEVNASWTPAGEDMAGWRFKTQTYDWKGRPRVSHFEWDTTNASDTEIQYNGCGCAGGEVMTTLSETVPIPGTSATGRRQQKIYRDILGRTVKTEALDWNGNVYAATISTYNARDQLTVARQYAGPEGSSSYQDTSYTFDGLGRLASTHAPEQDAGKNTVYTYFKDGKPQTITDARNAQQSFTYNNNRRLLTQVQYSVPSGSNIPVTPTVTFTYDAAGNRTQMNDGLGWQSYEYDSLSRLTAETRHFNDTIPYTSSDFRIEYQYNVGGQLTRLTEPFGEKINYAHDRTGKIISVNGTDRPHGGGTLQYINDIKYRAWGEMRQVSYGNNSSVNMSYNERMQPINYSRTEPYLSTSLTYALTYQYYADGRLRRSDETQTAPWYTTWPLRFSRSYEYDFLGRLIIAKTGKEARGQYEGDFNYRPYRQTMTYDPFGHQTVSDRWHYTEHYTSTFSYSNNRQASEQFNGATINPLYDEDGRIRTFHEGYNVQLDGLTYDAAGDVISRPEQPYWRDGNRNIIKSSKDLEIDGADKTTYSVLSSVLGGEAIAKVEVISNSYSSQLWVDKTTQIKAGGTNIARRKISDYRYNQQLMATYDLTVLINRDPSGVIASESQIHAVLPTAYTYAYREDTEWTAGFLEVDPLGANVSLFNPYTPVYDPQYGGCYSDGDESCQDEYEYGETEDYEENGYGDPQANTCYVNGFEAPCQAVADHPDQYEDENGNDLTEEESAEEPEAPSDEGPQAIHNSDSEIVDVKLGEVSTEKVKKEMESEVTVRMPGPSGVLNTLRANLSGSLDPRATMPAEQKVTKTADGKIDSIEVSGDNCWLQVRFNGSVFTPGLTTGVKAGETSLGPGVREQSRGPFYGVGFEVRGVVNGGVQRVTDRGSGPDEVVNKSGTWQIGQQVAYRSDAIWQETDKESGAISESRTREGSGKAQKDSPNADFRKIDGNNFAWTDSPGVAADRESDFSKTQLRYLNSRYNFTVYAQNGNERCEIRFHIGQFANGIGTYNGTVESGHR